MRKCICRLRLNEVSRQWGRRPEPPPSASCSCISCSPTGCPPRGEVGRRPASGRSSRQGMSPPHGCGGRSHGSAARSRCWYGCGSNARWENRSRSAFPLYNFLGHSLLSPFRMVCGNFILPEPASYVFFYAIFNLRKLFYLIHCMTFWQKTPSHGTWESASRNLRIFSYACSKMAFMHL